MSKTGLLSHNFGQGYASKSIKGCIDADFDLVCQNNLSQKMGQWVGVRDQGNSAKNAKTCPYCGITSKKKQIQSEKIFFDLN